MPLDTERQSVRYFHRVSETGRLLPSASRWNAIELDFNLAPKSSNSYDPIPSQYSKSYDYNLVITDRKHFLRFIFIFVSIIFLIIAVVLLLHFLPKKHKDQAFSVNFKVAINRALTFYDAQKSGIYPRNSTVKFRGDSGLEDGKSPPKPANLAGGFYDSGNNIKFTLTTAYTVTLLSWSVIEYRGKYEDIGELNHVGDIIRWGAEYLLKVTVLPNATSPLILYSQVGSTNKNKPDDMTCWQRPEDMNYTRPVSICDSSASDLAGELVAALSAASLVFKEETDFSEQLLDGAKKLHDVATTEDPKKQGTYTLNDDCGKEARTLYESSGYKDELAWGGTWLFLATGNTSFLKFATDTFNSARSEETNHDKGIFYWNNKLSAIAVLLTRVLFYRDPGSSYKDVLTLSSDMTSSLMCSYLFTKYLSRTPGGLIVLQPDNGSLLQYAATASFLSKLYSDYLDGIHKSSGSCKNDVFSTNMLHTFSTSQVNYILGDNPQKMSYMVGFGDKFPTRVYHRSASTPWDGKQYTCDGGKEWLNSTDPNPQVVLGAMVGGPDIHDNFTDDRKQLFNEPSIASNAGLVAALIALQDPPLGSTPFKDSMWR